MTGSDNWEIVEKAFPGEDYAYKETVFTIGNGYFASRGSFEEGYPGENPTTFVHGVFNDVPTFGTELVNFPSWFTLRILVDGEVFNLAEGKIIEYSRKLAMTNGLLSRKILWENPDGKRLTCTFERFTNMADIHHGALRFSFQDFNFTGKIQIQTSLPGVVSNERYRHWLFQDQGPIGENGCYLVLETAETHIRCALAEIVTIESTAASTQQFWNTQWVPSLVYDFDVLPGDEIKGVKHVTIFTSRDETDPVGAAKTAVSEISGRSFEDCLSDSESEWRSLWDRSNVTIEGDDLADNALRYNLFQILAAAPRHDESVSIGAKTLSGYGYRGHVFWDTEIFILPFLIFTQPEIARKLLMYRYHTLPGARRKAKQNGFKGAMYAWESAGTGDEVTPTWVVGPGGELIRIWCGDIEQHITADIAYGIKQYWQVTGDDPFMQHFGAEIVLSAAQFYASRLEWDDSDGQFHIRDVIGPDEYHEHVDDNAMTNLMAGWTLRFGCEIAAWMRDISSEEYHALIEGLALTEEEIAVWDPMADKIALHVSTEEIIEQFTGYFDLDFVAQETLEPRHQSLQSLFGIQGVQAYQFIKQPDVVMALFLMRDLYSQEIIDKNMAFYTPRTDLSQGSSLGASIQSLMLARSGKIDDAKALFQDTLLTDLENKRGNTEDGLHAASAGAVWQVILFGFLGFDVENGEIVVNPRLPKG